MDEMVEDVSEWQAAARVIEDGPMKGYIWHPEFDPFEHHIGPLGYKKLEDGRYTCAFYAEKKHLNGGDFLHGGMLMGFADFCLFALAGDTLQGPAVTLSFNADFTAAVGAGRLIECEGEVVRNTRSIVFVRGIIRSGDIPLLNFSGVVKRLGA